jgi:membrane protein YqaA with SNARE-associated domain
MDTGFAQEMFSQQIIAAVGPTMARSARHWIFHLGALGLIPLGLLDSSVIPIPGSMDVLTIVLSARNGGFWIYYALMATLGSVIGGYVTYHLARKGGKETLARKFSRRTMEKSYEIFARWGFGAIATAAVLPPPVPMVPFILAAGAMRYPVGRFLAAMTLGRVVRYSILAYLGARYGRYMLKFVAHLPHPLLVISVALIATAIVVLVVVVIRSRRKHSAAA